MAHPNGRPDARPLLLVAEDETSQRVFLQHQLEAAGYRVLPARNGRESLELVSDQVSVALLDLGMPDLGGLECMREIRRQYPDVECIVVTASQEVSDAVGAMKAGAFDYVTKPVRVDELLEAVRRAGRTVQLARENRQLREAIGVPWTEIPFIGRSVEASRVLELVRRIARHDGTVLITGESGVGKGLLARMIHQASARSTKPFVTVSCTALPRELVEAELFGHEKGSFTGAHERRPGRLEIADEGTLFLDEIGDMPLDLQPKLLTFLQERSFHRIGGNKSISVDVRVITATHQNLKELCRDKRFRDDLFFRINVLPIEIPPLRDRREDIPAIADYFLQRINERRNGNPFTLSAEARQALVEYAWPGNVRELENVLQRTTAFCASSRIEREELPAEVLNTQPNGDLARDSLAGLPLREVERLAILQTLESCRGNRAEAARRLGISKKGIYIKMRRLGLAATTG